MNKFAMYGKLKTHPGKRDELVALLLESTESLMEMEGCEYYIINVDEDDPDTIWISELWSDKAAHDDSLKDARVLDVIGRARPLIAGIEPIRTRPVGGKGL